MYSITNIAFKPINLDYSWGDYGGFRVIIHMPTGYINVTHLCGLAKNKNGSKKEFTEWRRNKLSKELMAEVASSLGMNISDLLFVHITANKLRGTYAHPELVPHIASWASTHFAISVGKIINRYIISLSLEKHIIRENELTNEINTLREQLKYYKRSKILISLLSSRCTVGCVYFICEVQDDTHEIHNEIHNQTQNIIVKIGHTYNLPKRLSTLQCGNKNKLEVFHSILCCYPDTVELFIHQDLCDYRIRGEWFMINRDILINSIQSYRLQFT